LLAFVQAPFWRRLRLISEKGATWPDRSTSASAAGPTSRGGASSIPKGLSPKKELEFSSRQLTAIEINGTFYRTQSPDSFRKWRDETPDGFMFTVKAHRFSTTRKTPDEMRDSISWFLNSGVLELGDKLGPVNWQFAPTRAFDPAYFDAFMGLLPHELGGRRLRHALEVRHPSFASPEFVDLLRRHDVAPVFTDAEDWPTIPDPTSDFIYARLQRTREEVETGYTAEELDFGASAMRAWAAAGSRRPCLPFRCSRRPTRPGTCSSS
jgi:uncharacterized protein YecE (DUF72 family)